LALVLLPHQKFARPPYYYYRRQESKKTRSAEIASKSLMCRGADKSLARPGSK